jgi:hypothetical protein
MLRRSQTETLAERGVLPALHVQQDQQARQKLPATGMPPLYMQKMWAAV